MNKIDFSPILNAYSSLDKALKEAKSDLEKSGAIQRFEYCYELSWKFMRKVLKQRGLEYNSPREVFRAAAQEGLIEDPEKWFEAIRKRNLTVHTYDEDFANEIFHYLPTFKQEMQKLIDLLKQMQS